MGFDKVSKCFQRIWFALAGGSTVQMLVKEIDGFHFVIELWDNYIYVMDCDDAMWAKTQLGQTAPTITLSTEDMISSN